MNIFQSMFWSFAILVFCSLILEACKTWVIKGEVEKLAKAIYKKNNKIKLIRRIQAYDMISYFAYHFSMIHKKSKYDNNFSILLAKRIKIKFSFWLFLFFTAIILLLTNYNFTDFFTFSLDLKNVIDTIICCIDSNKQYFTIVSIVILFLIFSHYKNKFSSVIYEEIHDELVLSLKFNKKAAKLLDKILYDVSSNMDVILDNCCSNKVNYCAIESMKTVISNLEYNDSRFEIKSLIAIAKNKKLKPIKDLSSLKVLSEKLQNMEGYFSTGIWFKYNAKVIYLSRLYLDNSKLLQSVINDFITDDNFNKIKSANIQKKLEQIKQEIDKNGCIGETHQGELEHIYNKLKIDYDYQIVKVIKSMFYMDKFCQGINEILKIKHNNLAASIKDVKK